MRGSPFPSLQHEKKVCILSWKSPIWCPARLRERELWLVASAILMGSYLIEGHQLLQYEHFSLILCSQKPSAQLLGSSFNLIYQEPV